MTYNWRHYWEEGSLTWSDRFEDVPVRLSRALLGYLRDCGSTAEVQICKWDGVRWVQSFRTKQYPKEAFEGAVGAVIIFPTDQDDESSDRGPKRSPRRNDLGIKIQILPSSKDEALSIQALLQVLVPDLEKLLSEVYSAQQVRMLRKLLSDSARNPLNADAHIAYPLLHSLDGVVEGIVLQSFWRISRTTGNLEKLADLFPSGDYNVTRTEIEKWPLPPTLSQQDTEVGFARFPPAILVSTISSENDRLRACFRSITASGGGTGGRVIPIEGNASTPAGLNAFVPLPEPMNWGRHSKNTADEDVIRFYRSRIRTLVEHYKDKGYPRWDTLLVLSAQKGSAPSTGRKMGLKWKPVEQFAETSDSFEKFEICVVIAISDRADANLSGAHLLRAIDRINNFLPLFDLLSVGRSTTKHALGALASCLKPDSEVNFRSSLTRFFKSIVDSGTWALFDHDSGKPILSSHAFLNFDGLKSATKGVTATLSLHTNPTDPFLAAIVSHLSAQPRDAKKKANRDARTTLLVAPVETGKFLVIAKHSHWKLRPVETEAVQAGCIFLSDAFRGASKPGTVAESLSVPALVSDVNSLHISVETGSLNARGIILLGIQGGARNDQAFFRTVIEWNHVGQRRREETQVGVKKASIAAHAIKKRSHVIGTLTGRRIVLKSEQSRPVKYYGQVHALDGDVIVAYPVHSMGDRRRLGVIVASFAPNNFNEAFSIDALGAIALSIASQTAIKQNHLLNAYEESAASSMRSVAVAVQREPYSRYESILNDRTRDPRANMSPEMHVMFPHDVRAHLMDLMTVAGTCSHSRSLDLSVVLPSYSGEAERLQSLAATGTAGDRAILRSKRHSMPGVGKSEFDHEDHFKIIRLPQGRLIFQAFFSEGKPIRHRFVVQFMVANDSLLWVGERALHASLRDIRTMLRMRTLRVSTLNESAALMRQRVIDFWAHDIVKIASSDALRGHLETLKTAPDSMRVCDAIKWAHGCACEYIKRSKEAGEIMPELVPLSGLATSLSDWAPSSLNLYLYELLVEQILTFSTCMRNGHPCIYCSVDVDHLSTSTVRICIKSTLVPDQPQTLALAPYLFNVAIPDDVKRSGKGRNGSGLFFCGRLLRSSGIRPSFRISEIRDSVTNIVQQFMYIQLIFDVNE